MKPLRCKEYASLRNFNSFGVEATARYFYPVYDESHIAEVYQFAKKHCLPLISLGEGSNIVFRETINSVVMLLCLRHRKVSIASHHIDITIGAGNNWHELVRWTLKQGYYGLENLSLIPGTVGAAPIQNIGAYGVELKEVLLQVRGYKIDEDCFITLTNEECLFGYRDSIFKTALQNNFVITEVTLRLSPIFYPNLDYGELKNTVESMSQFQPLTGLSVSDAVCYIRQQKLPDPKKLGNAGSFFKNPIVTQERFNLIRQKFPKVVAYPLKDQQWKLAAGWLIDACGLKGFRKGRVGTFSKQALVLVNHGEATGGEIIAFATMIKNKVYECFNVMLEIEPCVYP